MIQIKICKIETPIFTTLTIVKCSLVPFFYDTLSNVSSGFTLGFNLFNLKMLYKFKFWQNDEKNGMNLKIIMIIKKLWNDFIIPLYMED